MYSFIIFLHAHRIREGKASNKGMSSSKLTMEATGTYKPLWNLKGQYSTCTSNYLSKRNKRNGVLFHQFPSIISWGLLLRTCITEQHCQPAVSAGKVSSYCQGKPLGKWCKYWWFESWLKYTALVSSLRLWTRYLQLCCQRNLINHLLTMAEPSSVCITE